MQTAIRIFSLALIGACLNACAPGPAPQIATPPPALPDAFYFAPNGETEAELDALLPVNDPAYKALSDAVLAGAPSLAEALARVEMARARARQAGSARRANIGFEGTVNGTRINPNQFGTNTPFTQFIDTERVSYGTNLVASWDADLFGVLKARERAALARIDAASASAAAVRIALLAEIAGSVVDWRVLELRQAAITGDVDAAEQLAELAGVREAAGISPGFDRASAAATASASRSRLAALESEKVRIVGRLITLTGRPGAEVSALLEQPSDVFTPGHTPAHLPSELLINRPDVTAANAELAASDAELAAAARSRFPQITLSGVIGLLAFNPSDLFDDEALTGTLAAGIAAPLLDFGRIEAEIDAAAAGKRVAFQAYRGAVYQALGDAEAGYGLVAATDRTAELALNERDQLQRAARLADERHRAGLASFLEVLEARRAADASGERAAIAAGSAQRARIILWQALGGDARHRGNDGA